MRQSKPAFPSAATPVSARNRSPLGNKARRRSAGADTAKTSRWLVVHFIMLCAGHRCVECTPLNAEARAEINLARWQSSACRAFYEKPASPASLMATLEDRCESGRRETKPFHVAQEVTLVPKLKLAYVTVRKAASTTIGHLLHKIAGGFGGKEKCGRRGSAKRIGQCTAHPDMNHWWHGLCNSLCLDEHDLSTYYFFSFVRSPLSRFYSSFAQMLSRKAEHPLEVKAWRAANGSAHARTQMMFDYLGLLGSGRCSHDLHLETQSMSLATPTAAFGGDHNSSTHRPQLRLDFVGRTENLLDDFELMLKRAGSKTGVNVSSKVARVHQLLGPKARAAAKLTQHKSTERLEVGVDEARTAELDRRVVEVYAQDVACFGD